MTNSGDPDQLANCPGLFAEVGHILDQQDQGYFVLIHYNGRLVWFPLPAYPLNIYMFV